MKKIIYKIILLWLVVLPLQAEVNNRTLAVLVNSNDPESIEIARYYQQARLIPESNVIFLNFNAHKNALSVKEFENIEADLKAKVDDNIQAYVLAWRKPWRVGCMSITSAFSSGFNREFCAKKCRSTRPIAYFNSNSRQPYTDFKIRPSMMLSAGSVEEVKALIDRGVKADYTRPDSTGYLLSTSDKHRNVRAVNYLKIKAIFDRVLKVDVIKADAIINKTDILFYFTGLKKVKWVNKNDYIPGAIADHLTSAGGALFNGGQMSVLDWIDAGATGTFGAVVEPCNFTQKFPAPGIVMHKYLSGNTLIEAYWKSVKMPGQGVFVGEPLASPYKGCVLGVDKFKQFHYLKSNAGNYVERKYENCN